jgi:hypothetical protein
MEIFMLMAVCITISVALVITKNATRCTRPRSAGHRFPPGRCPVDRSPHCLLLVERAGPTIPRQIRFTRPLPRADPDQKSDIRSATLFSTGSLCFFTLAAGNRWT